MKILFSANSWIYDMMLASFPVWEERGVSVSYDLLLEPQLIFAEKILKNKKKNIHCFFKYMIDNWSSADISDLNIYRLEKEIGLRLQDALIYDVSLEKFHALPVEKDKDGEYWKRYFVCAISYYHKLIKDELPDFVFGEGPHGMGMKILFHICLKRRIPYFSFYGSYLEDRATFAFGKNGQSLALKYFFEHPEHLSQDDFSVAQKIIYNVRNKNQMMYYQANYGKSISIFPNFSRFFVFMSELIGFLGERLNRKKRLLQLLQGKVSPLWRLFAFRWHKYLNYKYIKKIQAEPQQDRGYVIYFNHLQPEATTSVWAPYNDNQWNLIENIVKSLSGDLSLYIKEHSTDMGNRGKSFYQNLLIYPNLYLINPLVNSISLIKNSFLTFTISGTVGLESIILNKPIAVFSNCYYSFFEGVKVISRPEEIEEAIGWARDWKGSKEEDILRFMAAYVRSAYPTKFACPNLESEKIIGDKNYLERFASGILMFLDDYKKYNWNSIIEKMRNGGYY